MQFLQQKTAKNDARLLTFYCIERSLQQKSILAPNFAAKMGKIRTTKLQHKREHFFATKIATKNATKIATKMLQKMQQKLLQNMQQKLLQKMQQKLLQRMQQKLLQKMMLYKAILRVPVVLKIFWPLFKSKRNNGALRDLST